MNRILLIAIICAGVLTVVFTQFSLDSNSGGGDAMAATADDDAYKPSPVIRDNVETYWQIMRAAVYDDVTSDRASEFTEDMEWFAGFVSERIERYGELKSIDAPIFVGPGDASIVVKFDENAYAFNLLIDSKGEIAEINLVNYADQEKLSKLSWSDLGDDTLRTQTLTDLSTFQEAFQNDDGTVRLVSILSPT